MAKLRIKNLIQEVVYRIINRLPGISYEKRFRFSEVDPGKLYRSSKPALKALSYFLKQYGIKSIVVLSETCDLNEWRLVKKEFFIRHMPLKKGHPPNEVEVSNLLNFITNPFFQPVLIHCNQGRDRTGYICLIYRIKKNGVGFYNSLQRNGEIRIFIFSMALSYPKTNFRIYRKKLFVKRRGKMYLRESKHLLQLWQYSLNEGANVVIMRHGPKASDDTSGLSKEGKKLTREYGDILNSCNSLKNEFWIKMALFATSKSRTVDTLELLFPESYYINYFIQTSLDTVAVTEETQRICNDFHAKVGHWRGYSVSQSYFYLQKYSGTDYGNLHSEVLHRMSNGIRELFNRYEDRLVIYCGHSPQAEMAVAEVTGLDISELGWFLNPLSSVHLRMKDGKVEFVSRINPIIGYVDLESETFFRS